MGGHGLSLEAQRSRDGETQARLQSPFPQAEGQIATGAPCSGKRGEIGGGLRVEHVFAGQKHRMKLFVRTIGIARAKVKIGMANLAYNFNRLAWLKARPVSA